MGVGVRVGREEKVRRSVSGVSQRAEAAQYRPPNALRNTQRGHSGSNLDQGMVRSKARIFQCTSAVVLEFKT